MTRLSNLLLTLTLVAALTPRAAAYAQESASAEASVTAAVGDRVRVSRFGGKPRAGRVVALPADSLVVEWLNGSRERVPMFEVSALEISRGRRRYLIGGTAGGLAVGAGVGLLLRNIREQDLGYDAFGSRPREKRDLFPIAMAGGTVLGAILGAMGTERWLSAPVAAPGTRIGFLMPSQRGGIGLGVSGSW